METIIIKGIIGVFSIIFIPLLFISASVKYYKKHPEKIKKIVKRFILVVFWSVVVLGLGSSLYTSFFWVVDLIVFLRFK
jgi:hypothetical protein